LCRSITAGNIPVAEAYCLHSLRVAATTGINLRPR
jgi:hypothetical protein